MYTTKPLHRRLRFTAALLAGLLPALVACTTVPTPEQRRQQVDALAGAQGWRAVTVNAGAFDLQTYAPAPVAPVDTLTIYIEGDGFAWRTLWTPSDDPTPRQPLALAMALAQPEGTAAYLARPCQYTGAQSRGCAEPYWTHARFAPEVIEASARAVDALKARFGAHRLVLVGYSGGGAVAALVAARRGDVTRLITVAGNLDHAAWTRLHGMAPLTESLNAAEASVALQALPQWHFVGADDPVIPPPLARGFPAGFIGAKGGRLRIIDGFDHRCCWAAQWPALWREAVSSSGE